MNRGSGLFRGDPEPGAPRIPSAARGVGPTPSAPQESDSSRTVAPSHESPRPRRPQR